MEKTTSNHANRSNPEILAIQKDIENFKIHTLRMLFTDIDGKVKCLDYTNINLGPIFDNEILIDGSSVKGFAEPGMSDMYIRPDFSSWRFTKVKNSVFYGYGFLFCNVFEGDNKTPFYADGRNLLMQAIQKSQKMGFSNFYVGLEPEFFLIKQTTQPVNQLLSSILYQNNNTKKILQEGSLPSIEKIPESLGDQAGYFDIYPIDKGEHLRIKIAQELSNLGIIVEKHHHEVAPGQHEINFRFAESLRTADNLVLYKMIVKNVAYKNGYIATFMPKLLANENGNGLHVNCSLWKGNKNIFYDSKNAKFLSKRANHFIGGLLNNAASLCAFTNSIHNSYRRLKTGYEAPTNIAYSQSNRSAMIRVPAIGGKSCRIEIRATDAASNIYFTLAAILQFGLWGIEKKASYKNYECTKNIFSISPEKLKEMGIYQLPQSLRESLNAVHNSKIVNGLFGEKFIAKYLKVKLSEIKKYKFCETEVITTQEIELYYNY